MRTDNTDETDQSEQANGSERDGTPDESFASEVEWFGETDATAPRDEEVFYRGGTASVAPEQTPELHPFRPISVLVTFPHRPWIVFGVALSLLAGSLVAGHLAIGTSVTVTIATLGGSGLFLASLLALYLGIVVGSTGSGVVKFPRSE